MGDYHILSYLFPCNFICGTQKSLFVNAMGLSQTTMPYN